MADMTTIVVSAGIRDRLRRLADEDRLSLDGELGRMLDRAEGERFWAGVRADYARLRSDAAAWDGYAAELAEWEPAAGDGLAAGDGPAAG